MVYLDLAVFLNFCVDFLLLLGTNRLSGFPLGMVRCALAALLGSIYAGACLLPGFLFLGNLVWRCVSLAGIGVVAFGYNRSAMKRIGVFLLLSLSMGGMAVCMGNGNLPMLILEAGAVWLLCRIIFGSAMAQQAYVPVTLRWGDKSAGIIALRDSGNTLRDPVTGEQVLVIDGDVASRLTGLSKEQLRNPVETMARHPIAGLRLIPYQAVGSGTGLLLGLRFSSIKIGDREQSAVVAFAPEGLGSGQMVQALTGGVQ